MSLLLHFYLIFFYKHIKEGKRYAVGQESENVALYVSNSGQSQVLLIHLGMDNWINTKLLMHKFIYLILSQRT